MNLQEIYHELQTWIIMLDSPYFKENDAGLVRKEMIDICSRIWREKNE